GREGALLITGRQTFPLRLKPDLQEVRRLRVGRVELTVAHPCAGTHPLHVTGAHDRAHAGTVFVRQLAFDHVGDDLHVLVPMGAKAHARCDVVLVDHQQVAESGVARIVISVEGERVMAIEPRGLSCPTLVRLSYRYHGCFLSWVLENVCVQNHKWEYRRKRVRCDRAHASMLCGSAQMWSAAA